LLYVAYFVRGDRSKIRTMVIALLTAVVLIAGAGIAKSLKDRSDSASFRVFTWLSTFEMIKTHPVLGTGIGSFYVTYPAFRRPQIFFIEGRHNTETDHSENEYLEVWFDEGTVGFGIFLALLGTFLVMGFKNLQMFALLHRRKEGEDPRAYYQLAVLTAVIAQLVHNAVCVSLRFVSSGVMLWLFIGIIGSLAVNHPLPEKTEPEEPKNRLPEMVRRLLQLAVIGAVSYGVWLFYGYFQADVNHNRAIFFSKQGQWEAALNTYNQVAKANPSFIMPYYFMGNVYNDRWGVGDGDLSIAAYKKAWVLAPNYVQSHHQAGLIYLKWGQDESGRAQEALKQGKKKEAEEHENKKKELWQQALKEFDRYRLIDPIFNLNYYRMAWIYTQLGALDDAERIYKAHIEFPQELQKAPHNIWVEDWAKRRASEYAETMVNLGNLRFMRNDPKGSEEYYRKALALDERSLSAIKNLAILCGRQNKRDEAMQLWQKARLISPTDADVQKVFGPNR
jgi:tetratricopeptide (TPR) repeat protein